MNDLHNGLNMVYLKFHSKADYNIRNVFQYHHPSGWCHMCLMSFQISQLNCLFISVLMLTTKETSEVHITKIHKILIFYILLNTEIKKSQTLLKPCTEHGRQHGSNAAMLCAKFQQNSGIKIDDSSEWDFVRKTLAGFTILIGAPIWMGTK